MSASIETVEFPLSGEQTFDEVIDVRSPAEYAEDHMAGAVNLPVLSDQERIEVGTLYKQSPFEARKLGASLVSANIAIHLKGPLRDKPGGYRPLVYCWRGGQRSRSLATVLQEIGWRVAVLKDGYKGYRKHVLRALEIDSERLSFQMINGLTGAGKTRLLHVLKARGAQVLDLEGLASHKGSVFGGEEDSPQPSQKRFESLLYDALSGYDPGQVIFVEAESPKIGRLNLPRPLWLSLRESPVLELDVPLGARVSHLEQAYQSWLADPDRVLATLERLRPFHAAETIEQWKSWCAAGAWSSLIEALLREHYDQRYGAGSGNSRYEPPSRCYQLPELSEHHLETCAAAILSDQSHFPEKDEKQAVAKVAADCLGT